MRSLKCILNAVILPWKTSSGKLEHFMCIVTGHKGEADNT